jgi:hypothetical protein
VRVTTVHHRMPPTKPSSCPLHAPVVQCMESGLFLSLLADVRHPIFTGIDI